MKLTLSGLEDQLSISTPQSATRNTGVVDAGSWKDGSDSSHFRGTILQHPSRLTNFITDLFIDQAQLFTWIWTEMVKGCP